MKDTDTDNDSEGRVRYVMGAFVGDRVSVEAIRAHVMRVLLMNSATLSSETIELIDSVTANWQKSSERGTIETAYACGATNDEIMLARQRVEAMNDVEVLIEFARGSKHVADMIDAADRAARRALEEQRRKRGGH